MLLSPSALVVLVVVLAVDVVLPGVVVVLVDVVVLLEVAVASAVAAVVVAAVVSRAVVVAAALAVASVVGEALFGDHTVFLWRLGDRELFAGAFPFLCILTQLLLVRLRDCRIYPVTKRPASFTKFLYVYLDRIVLSRSLQLCG